MTPGESYEYTSGSSESFRRVEITRVIPGCADVRRAFGVSLLPGYQHCIMGATVAWLKQGLTTRYTRRTQGVKQR